MDKPCGKARPWQVRWKLSARRNAPKTVIPARAPDRISSNVLLNRELPQRATSGRGAIVQRCRPGITNPYVHAMTELQYRRRGLTVILFRRTKRSTTESIGLSSGDPSSQRSRALRLIGGPFFPGIEASFVIALPATYEAPLPHLTRSSNPSDRRTRCMAGGFRRSNVVAYSQRFRRGQTSGQLGRLRTVGTTVRDWWKTRPFCVADATVRTGAVRPNHHSTQPEMRRGASSHNRWRRTRWSCHFWRFARVTIHSTRMITLRCVWRVSFYPRRGRVFQDWANPWADWRDAWRSCGYVHRGVTIVTW